MIATNGTSKRKKVAFATRDEASTMASTISSRSTLVTHLSPQDHAKRAVSSYLASLPEPIALAGRQMFHQHLQLIIEIEKTKHRIRLLAPDTAMLPKSTQ
jgi:hypothetical protein